MANYVTITSDKSKWLAFWLCCLGVIGFAGIHYFYVGRYFMGLLYFFTFGFFGIGTLIDIIKTASGNFLDNSRAPLRH